MIWFFGIVGDYFGGVCLCFLITLGIVAGILYLLHTIMYPKCTYTPISLIISVAMFVLLFVQSVLIYGAMSIKSEIGNYANTVQTEINRYYREAQRGLNRIDAQEFTDKLTSKYPITKKFIDEINIKNYDIEHIADAYAKLIKSALNIYIWKRVGWSLIFLIAGTFAIYKSSASGGRKNSTRRSASYRSRMSTYRY